MTRGSPEFSLACACAMWPPSADRAARIRRAAAAEIDPRMLLRVARRHGVVGLVADGLLSAAIDIPEPLARIARRRSLAALRQAEEALRLDALFAAADIPLLFLKGIPLAQRAYATIGLREAVDIDLAVARDDIDRAWRLMREAGYAAAIPAKPLTGAARRHFLWATKDSLHRHPDHAIPVELHWRLSDDLRDPATPPPHRWQRIALSPDGRSRRSATTICSSIFARMAPRTAGRGSNGLPTSPRSYRRAPTAAPPCGRRGDARVQRPQSHRRCCSATNC